MGKGGLSDMAKKNKVARLSDEEYEAYLNELMKRSD